MILRYKCPMMLGIVNNHARGSPSLAVGVGEPPLVRPVSPRRVRLRGLNAGTTWEAGVGGGGHRHHLHHPLHPLLQPVA